MANGGGSGSGPGSKIGPGPKITSEVHAATFEADLDHEEEAEEQDDHSPLAHDPEEDSDAGGSGLLDGDELIRGPSDRESLEDLPLLHKLPKSARPPVYFFIDESFEVHPLGSPEAEPADMRSAIAHAIAQHLKSNRIRLQKRGDWRHIPRIGSDADLRKLAIRQFGSERVMSSKRGGSGKTMSILVGLNHYSSEYKAFAIVLPNGDVVTPQALITPARSSKRNPRRATRAGGLRALADATVVGLHRPSELAGEPWDEQLWNAFEKAQRQSQRKSQAGQEPGNDEHDVQ